MFTFACIHCVCVCVCVVCDMSLLFLCVYTKVDRVHHEEVVQAKEEELAKAVEERDELKCTLKSAENKLEELKGKNNVSHSCYMYIDVCVFVYNVCV